MVWLSSRSGSFSTAQSPQSPEVAAPGAAAQPSRHQPAPNSFSGLPRAGRNLPGSAVASAGGPQAAGRRCRGKARQAQGSPDQARASPASGGRRCHGDALRPGPPHLHGAGEEDPRVRRQLLHVEVHGDTVNRLGRAAPPLSPRPPHARPL